MNRNNAIKDHLLNTQSYNHHKEIIKTWSKDNNFGITHYGLPPHLFSLSLIVPNTLHLCSLLAKNLMTNTQTFVIKEVK